MYFKIETITRVKEKNNNELTLSQSFCSSVIATGERISGRMLNACPSLMYAGPKDVTISRSSMARATSFWLCKKDQKRVTKM